MTDSVASGSGRSWWVHEIVIASIVGLLVSAASILGQMVVDDRRSARDAAAAADQLRHAEQLSNLQFVRSLSSADPDITRPFARLDLAGMDLVGLELDDAVFAYADLAGADFTQTDLRRANMTRANLTGANLSGADLTDAYLGADQLPAKMSDRRGADLIRANLAGTVLTGADLTGAVLTDLYYDASTRWPQGFTPPPSRGEP